MARPKRRKAVVEEQKEIFSWEDTPRVALQNWYRLYFIPGKEGDHRKAELLFELLFEAKTEEDKIFTKITDETINPFDRPVLYRGTEERLFGLKEIQDYVRKRVDNGN